MCGILAVFSAGQPLGPAYLPLLRTLAHRGPDDAGEAWIDFPDLPEPARPRAWLGQHRLSIIDLTAGGHQPMFTADGRYAMIFNGEIYNYLELRAECQRAGAAFRSASDSEVLLQCWALWGERCLSRLVGMFAFVIVDREKQTATLVRDNFGIKPLYYAATGGEFLVASEIAALVATGRIAADPTPTLAYEYLRFGATDSNELTALRDVRSLPPAHLAVFDFATGRLGPVRRYWELRAEPRTISFTDAVAECRERFFQNIRLHLRSDVPVGAALSGGIDSSAVVCAMRQIEPGMDLRTFSYIAAETAHSEEKWVDIVHATVGGQCFKICPQPGDLVRDLATLVRHQGEPFASASIYAQYRVFRCAREQGVPVTLDGQGADELLGGYWPHVGTQAAALFRAGRWRQAWSTLGSGGDRRLAAQMLAQSLLPPAARAVARRFAGKDLLPSYFNPAWFRDQQVDLAGTADALVGRHPTLHAHLVANATRGSLPNLLRYADRNSMAFSIESRVPFLTPDFATFLLSLPADYLVGPDGTRKRVFREAMRGVLPEPIRTRRDKIGFFADDALWLRHNAAVLQPLCLRAAEEPMFDGPRLRVFLDDFFAGRHHSALLVWRVLVFALWLETMRSVRPAR
jgi:asparagine synthase (glutamine-hydrolysing)